MRAHFGVFAILGLLCGCASIEDVVDPTERCHDEFTESGAPFRICAVNSGVAYIKTDYGDLDCGTWHGHQDCGRTAELYIGGIQQCEQDLAADISGQSDF
jgi:hypothetical protein